MNLTWEQFEEPSNEKIKTFTDHKQPSAWYTAANLYGSMQKSSNPSVDQCPCVYTSMTKRLLKMIGLKDTEYG